MPWPVYSERFVTVQNAVTGTTAYIVPVGYRAVVKSFTVANLQAIAGRADLVVAGSTLLHYVFQATEQSVSTAVMAVAYGGEGIWTYKEGGIIAVGIQGYLFRDATLAREAPTGIVELERPEAKPVEELV